MAETEVNETVSLVEEDSSKNETQDLEETKPHPGDDEEEPNIGERQPLTELEPSKNRENEAESEKYILEKKMEAFEIEQKDGEGSSSILQQIMSEDMDDLDEEAQGLLADSPPPKSVGKTFCFCCEPAEKLGSCTVFLPSVFRARGWGIMGPHWFGPPCVMGVILSASSFFIRHGWNKVGPITGTICMLWTIMILYLLVNSAYRDPGIVKQGQETPTKHHRWCELCKNYQPPKGAHCPDCNVCIAGFDQYV
eukprot:scaffold4244_cov167-Amphora_coffeaeformis.AAC.15